MSQHPPATLGLAKFLQGEREMKFRTQYSYDEAEERRNSGINCKDPSLAQQHARDECDINTIVNRYLKQGVLPQIPLPPHSDAFAELFDFQGAMNTIAAAQQSFGRLSAEIRRRFGNDPAEFVTFCCAETDGKLDNLEEMRRMGLAVPKEPEPAPTPKGDTK